MAQPYMIIPAQGSDQADEWLRLGVDAQVAGNLPLAQQRYQQALRLDPRHALAAQNLAVVFAQTPGLINDALLAIERASMMDGVHGVIYTNHALMALEADRIEEALINAKKGVELSPPGMEGNFARMAYAMALTAAGSPQDSLPLYSHILDSEPTHPAAGPNSCFIQTLTNAKPKELLAQRQRWYAANVYKGEKRRHANNRKTDRPLRVGYVGGDFKCHSAAFIFGAVLLHHSPHVEMYLYCSLPVSPENDARTKLFQAACPNRWRDISTASDEQVETQIRLDQIDILVDLAGHTNGGRLALFTRKPAPIQVTAWGFAHGTGCPEIDYFFADPIAVPEAERQFYAEQIVDLPSIVTIDPPLEYSLKETSHAPLKKNGYITFGSYARYEKMSDSCLNTFSEILRRVPDAKLEFKDHAYRRPYSIKRIQQLMSDIAPERLLFSMATTHPDHLLSYQQADICLDPFPHGGGVVALEQLYMGVPLITLYGTQPSGRSAASVLTCMGRQDWIARTPEEYVEKAVALADDVKTLTKVRTTLRKELLESPAVKGYVEAVETVYKQIWEKWANS